MAERTLLHLDDDPQLTALIQRQLAAHQITSIPVNDPNQLMNQLTRTRARLVLLDVDMPGKDGLQVLREIKVRYGAEACFFKPVQDIQPLLACLEDCFRKIDRWWKCLGELVQRKRAMQAQPSNPG